MRKKKVTIEQVCGMLVQAVHTLGWSVGVPNSGKKKQDEDAKIIGLIIGEEPYIKAVMKALERGKFRMPRKKTK